MGNFSIKLPNKESIEMYTLCFILFFSQINLALHLLFDSLGIGSGFVTEALYLVYLLVFSSILFLNNKRILGALIYPTILFVLYLFSYMSLGNNFIYVDENVTSSLLLFCIPTYIAFYIVKNLSYLNKALNVFCNFLFLINIIAIGLSNIMATSYLFSDYQAISYSMIIPFVFFACKDKHSFLDFLKMGLILLVLLFWGGRSGVFCALVCIAYRLIKNDSKFFVKSLYIIIISALLMFFYKDILSWVITLSNTYEFGGSIAKYSNLGDIFSDSGRSAIFNISFEALKEMPFFGYGVGADRYYLGVYGFKFGNYPHNIFVELLLHFGYVVGTIFIILLLKLIFNGFKFIKLQKGKGEIFEICFFSTGFLVLLFSSSYLISPLFYAMIALLIRVDNKQKQNKLNSVGAYGGR